MASSNKKKFYVVWKGRRTGVFRTWDECAAQTHGVAGAKYKSYGSWDEAQRAFAEGAEQNWGLKSKADPSLFGESSEAKAPTPSKIGKPNKNSLCVDAAWNATTKWMEYQGVWYHDGSNAFCQGPLPNGTNNIGEFLAIVHGLAILKQKGSDWPIYSDSVTAISWVKHRNVKSQSIAKGETSPAVNDLVERALKWLKTNEYSTPILKWETEYWGENPADFGRK
jgi:ribonuclease HI